MERVKGIELHYRLVVYSGVKCWIYWVFSIVFCSVTCTRYVLPLSQNSFAVLVFSFH
jgi:hypothetical protein